ncbi:MAG TPA: hypothetical protein VMD09_14145 [Solirubrobacteraceae bacterium]|nr:hypothetical protein [Solirubrobacteraceae bacterium]
MAYFTTTGAGSGNAQVGTSSALTINATITPASGGLVPGGTPASVSFSVNNPGGNQYVSTVTLTGVQAFSDAGHTNNITGTGAGQCDTTKFTMTPVTENQDVGSGNTTLGTNGSLAFADSGTNQNACKGAYLVASFTSN